MDKQELSDLLLRTTEGYSNFLNRDYEKFKGIEVKRRRFKPKETFLEKINRPLLKLTQPLVNLLAYSAPKDPENENIDISGMLDTGYRDASVFMNSLRNYYSGRDGMVKGIRQKLADSVGGVDVMSVAKDDQGLGHRKSMYAAAATGLGLLAIGIGYMISSSTEYLDLMFYILGGGSIITGGKIALLKNRANKTELETLHEEINFEYNAIRHCEIPLLREVLDENREQLLQLINKKG